MFIGNFVGGRGQSHHRPTKAKQRPAFYETNTTPHTPPPTTQHLATEGHVHRYFFRWQGGKLVYCSKWWEGGGASMPPSSNSVTGGNLHRQLCWAEGHAITGQPRQNKGQPSTKPTPHHIPHHPWYNEGHPHSKSKANQHPTTIHHHPPHHTQLQRSICIGNLFVDRGPSLCIVPSGGGHHPYQRAATQ